MIYIFVLERHYKCLDQHQTWAHKIEVRDWGETHDVALV